MTMSDTMIMAIIFDVAVLAYFTVKLELISLIADAVYALCDSLSELSYRRPLAYMMQFCLSVGSLVGSTCHIFTSLK